LKEIIVSDAVSLKPLDKGSDRNPKTYALRIDGQPVSEQQYFAIPCEPIQARPIGVLLTLYYGDIEVVDHEQLELLWINEANELRRTPVDGDQLNPARDYLGEEYNLEDPVPNIYIVL
jgi:hypothetical protein